MKKNSKKSRQLQREKENRLEQEYAKAKASPDSRRGRRIHVIIIRWGLNHMIVNGNVRQISVHVRGTNLTWENRMVHGEYF
mgnify:CR=1 FL=1